MALDQSALLELSDALRSADGGEVMRRLLLTMLQALIVGVLPHVSLGVRPDVSFPRRSDHGIGGSGGVRNRSLSR